MKQVVIDSVVGTHHVKLKAKPSQTIELSPFFQKKYETLIQADSSSDEDEDQSLQQKEWKKRMKLQEKWRKPLRTKQVSVGSSDECYVDLEEVSGNFLGSIRLN